MRLLLLAASACTLFAQTGEDQRAFIQRLAREADIFERNAHRITGIETLKQTVPSGVRTSVGRRGIETGLPGFEREIVSEYGYLSADEPGGSLKEVRMVLTIDGLKWRKGNKGIESLAKQIAAHDDKQRRKLLEAWEDYGLHGFVTDLGQLILLFSRGRTTHYEIAYQETESSDGEPLWVYRYEQIGGDAALTVHGEGDKPKRERLRGRIWVRPRNLAPVRMSLESDRKDDKGVLRDVATVSYFAHSSGMLLPVRVLHQQFGDGELLVTNEFTYSGYKEVLPPSRR
jgi:hypothetical protein